MATEPDLGLDMDPLVPAAYKKAHGVGVLDGKSIKEAFEEKVAEERQRCVPRRHLVGCAEGCSHPGHGLYAAFIPAGTKLGFAGMDDQGPQPGPVHSEADRIAQESAKYAAPVLRTERDGLFDVQAIACDMVLTAIAAALPGHHLQFEVLGWTVKLTPPAAGGK